jgi:hypothetical protein
MLDISVRPDGFTAIVRLTERDRHFLALGYWIYLFMAVGFSGLALYNALPIDLVELAFAPLFLALPAIGAYHLNARVYGLDEVVVEGGSLIVRSVRPLGTRTRIEAASDQGEAWAFDRPLSAGTLRSVVVSGGAGRRTTEIRYALAREDANRLVALIHRDHYGAAA